MAAVLKPGEPDTSFGWLSVARRAWRKGCDAGRKEGANAFFQSPVMENIAAQLKLSGMVIDQLVVEIAERDRVVQAWKAEVEMWKAEHAKLAKLFDAVVKAVEK